MLPTLGKQLLWAHYDLMSSTICSKTSMAFELGK